MSSRRGSGRIGLDAFLLEMQSRRILVVGCTPYPNKAFAIQCLRQASDDAGLLSDGRLLLCDRDPTWNRRASAMMRRASLAAPVGRWLRMFTARPESALLQFGRRRSVMHQPDDGR